MVWSRRHVGLGVGCLLVLGSVESSCALSPALEAPALVEEGKPIVDEEKAYQEDDAVSMENAVKEEEQNTSSPTAFSGEEKMAELPAAPEVSQHEVPNSPEDLSPQNSPESETSDLPQDINQGDAESTENVGQPKPPVVVLQEETAGADVLNVDLKEITSRQNEERAAKNLKVEEGSKDQQIKIKPELDRAAPEVMAILKSGVLRVGMCTIDQPPFHERGRNGEFIGKDVNLARELAEALGVRLRFVEAPDWAATVELLLDGKIDIVLSNLTLLPERAARIYCSKPYARIRQCILLNRVLLTRAYGKGITTLRELMDRGDNRHLIIQEGTAYETAAATLFPKAQITITASWEEIMKKICDRECIGTISDELEIKKQTRTVQSMELLPVVLKGAYDSMVIGVSHSAPHLLHFINSFIDYYNVNFNVEDY